ncbi:bifunctional oligoribonuclease/PAP phosphatase NrnA [Robiginitalea sp. SC105]|uniref:DHH family phosphoesterase n=1 Tax=Robiginitalea sp. SC105 TaxID=2762332 RepID=UPI00163B514C|nr:bifunctional oligoribonuclease/PAP phosphatase NrnA [Robiginitalea sp. SC105]MBC2839225.1 bifunctional oligoribonuclease/PAP phosphatase NrnA [Robiginitalea sp. SC105]
MNCEDARTLRHWLSTPQRILLIPHKNPDGDAMGACLGLQHFLLRTQQAVTVASPNEFPAFLKWMPGAGEVAYYCKEQERVEALIREATLIFTLDFNALDRTGPMEEALKGAEARMVMIDHHQSPEDYADIRYSDVSMSSTCEMIYNTIVALDGAQVLSPQTAACLYAGILTDTGSFKFASTSPETLRVAALLMERGADHTEIHRQIFDTNRPERLRLLGIALKNMRILEPYNTAYITLSQEELDSCDYRKGDTEGFVNYGLSISGMVLAAIFIESREEGIIKISLRSRGSFSVNDMARTHFNGGGHINAAGGRSEAPLEETTRRFEALLPEYQEKLSNP